MEKDLRNQDGYKVIKLPPGVAEGAITTDGRIVLGHKTRTLFGHGLSVDSDPYLRSGRNDSDESLIDGILNENP